MLHNSVSMHDAVLADPEVFDKVSQINLFTKLIDPGYAAFIVCILYYWHSTLQYAVRCCQSFTRV